MRLLERQAEHALRAILEELPELRVDSPSARGHGCDLAVGARCGKARLRFCVQVKSRVTPQTALSACEQFRHCTRGTIPVIYAPTISPRVAHILREQGIGYADQAGNCWLRSPRDHLLIERRGFRSERKGTPPALDPFSPKSSRVVRALLSCPLDRWGVRKLAEHPDVNVSPALVVKVKRTLIEEGYAVEEDRLLALRDATGLLEAWSEKYPGPAEEVPLYFRGETAAAEQAVSRWCQDNALHHALGGFSAAWRLAPEVRYAVGAIYVEDRGFNTELLEQLAAEYGVRRVDTGPSVLLWRPFDSSVFAGSVEAGQPEQPVTSALQTWLDLIHAGGRGEDAARAVFDKRLRRDLEAVTERREERERAV